MAESSLRFGAAGHRNPKPWRRNVVHASPGTSEETDAYQGWSMRSTLAALFALALVAGCENRRGDAETGAADEDRSGVDTLIETERVRDTTVVTADTSIDVDTIEKTDHIEENR